MKLIYLCSSKDGRTNRWRITCDCGKAFEPTTTLYSTQAVECPKCGQRAVADYNAQTVTVNDGKEHQPCQK